MVDGTNRAGTAERRRVVVIEVEGGVAHESYVPLGVECVIYDHDDKKEEGQGREERESGADEARCKARAVSEGRSAGPPAGLPARIEQEAGSHAGTLGAALAAELDRTLADIAGDGATFEFDEDENEEGRFLRAVEEYETPNLAIKLEINAVPDAASDTVSDASLLLEED